LYRTGGKAWPQNNNNDPYFKAEPTKNEVIKCYYKVLVKSASEKDGKEN